MVQPHIYYKPSPVRLEELDSGNVTEEATKVISRLKDKDILSRDLIYLQRNGVKQTQLAIFFNTTTRTIRHWKKGQYKPRNLSYILMIREIARCLRARKKAQQEGGLKPRVVRC